MKQSKNLKLRKRSEDEEDADDKQTSVPRARAPAKLGPKLTFGKDDDADAGLQAPKSGMLANTALPVISKTATTAGAVSYDAASLRAELASQLRRPAPAADVKSDNVLINDDDIDDGAAEMAARARQARAQARVGGQAVPLVPGPVSGLGRMGSGAVTGMEASPFDASPQLVTGQANTARPAGRLQGMSQDVAMEVDDSVPPPKQALVASSLTSATAGTARSTGTAGLALSPLEAVAAALTDAASRANAEADTASKAALAVDSDLSSAEATLASLRAQQGPSAQAYDWWQAVREDVGAVARRCSRAQQGLQQATDKATGVGAIVGLVRCAGSVQAVATADGPRAALATLVNSTAAAAARLPADTSAHAEAFLAHVNAVLGRPVGQAPAAPVTDVTPLLPPVAAGSAPPQESPVLLGQVQAVEEAAGAWLQEIAAHALPTSSDGKSCLEFLLSLFNKWRHHATYGPLYGQTFAHLALDQLAAVHVRAQLLAWDPTLPGAAKLQDLPFFGALWSFGEDKPSAEVLRCNPELTAAVQHDEGILARLVVAHLPERLNAIIKASYNPVSLSQTHALAETVRDLMSFEPTPEAVAPLASSLLARLDQATEDWAGIAVQEDGQVQLAQAGMLLLSCAEWRDFLAPSAVEQLAGDRMLPGLEPVMDTARPQPQLLQWLAQAAAAAMGSMEALQARPTGRQLLASASA